MTTISADELALYDRQIRVLGLKTQEAILNANILLINIKSLGNEIAKNLVLAGIGSLTIMDDNLVTEDDLCSQFLVTDEDIGKPRGLAATVHLEKLNPRVNIFNESGDPLTKIPDFFSRFDVTIATDCSITTLLLLDSAVRFAQRAFYAAGSHGVYGFVFADLVEHSFIIERAKPNMPTKTGPETATRSVLSVSERKSTDGKSIIELVTKHEAYQPMILANASPLPEQIRSNRRRVKQVTPLLPCLRAVWEFEKAFSRLPSHSKPDLIAFTRLATEQCHELSMPIESLKDTFLRKFMQNLGSELTPTCAVLGGKLAEDVMNVLGKREQPIQNMLLFDGDNSTAPVYALYPLVPVQTDGMLNGMGNGMAGRPIGRDGITHQQDTRPDTGMSLEMKSGSG